MKEEREKLDRDLQLERTARLGSEGVCARRDGVECCVGSVGVECCVGSVGVECCVGECWCEVLCGGVLVWSASMPHSHSVKLRYSDWSKSCKPCLRSVMP